MTSYSQTRTNKNDQQDTDSKSGTVDVVKCRAYGCPMKTVITKQGGYWQKGSFCEFHQTAEDFEPTIKIQELTRVLNKYKKDLTNYARLVHWQPNPKIYDHYGQVMQSLKNNELIPMGENELFGPYLVRYFNELHEIIFSEAREEVNQ